MKILKKILKWSAVTLIVLITAVFAINRFDEKLKPEAVEFGKLNTSQVKPEENVLYSWIAFQSPLGEDIHKKGLEVFEEIEKRIKDGQSVPYYIDLVGSKSERIEFIGDRSSLSCTSTQTNCLKHYMDNAEKIEVLLSSNKVLLERYLSLYKYPHFKNTFTPSITSPTPAFVPINDGHSLFRANIAMMIKGGRAKDALMALSEDTRFWRGIIMDADTFIIKLVSIGQTNKNIRFLSEMLSIGGNLDQSFIDAAYNMVKPLNKEEISLELPLKREFMDYKDFLVRLDNNNIYMELYGRNSVSSIAKRIWGVIQMSFFKRNATINIFYKNYSEAVHFGNLSSREFPQRIKDIESKLTEAIDITYVYNPIGKVLAVKLFPLIFEFYEFYEKIYNLDGIMRMVTLSILIKEKMVKDSEINSFIQTMGSTYIDPYTGGFFKYDSGKRFLYFDGMDSKFKKRIEIPL